MIFIISNAQLQYFEVYTINHAKKSSDDDYFYYVFFNKKTQKTKVIIIPKNRLRQSKLRLIRKVEGNYYRWDWWLTLTFADHCKEYHIFNKDTGYDKTYTTTETLNSVSKYGFTNYIRDFFHRVRNYITSVPPEWLPHNLRRYFYYDSPSYFWIYEQGAKYNRPHFHGCISNLREDIRADQIEDKLTEWWRAGNVFVEPLNKDRNKVGNYLWKYVKKADDREPLRFDKFNGTRFWSTSRDIKPVKRNTNVEYIGYAHKIEFALYLKYKAIKWAKEGLDYRPYIDYKEAMRKISAGGIKYQRKITEFIYENLDTIKHLPEWAYIEHIDDEKGVQDPSFDFIKGRTINFK